MTLPYFSFFISQCKDNFIQLFCFTGTISNGKTICDVLWNDCNVCMSVGKGSYALFLSSSVNVKIYKNLFSGNVYTSLVENDK